MARQDEQMSAATRNGYREAYIGFGNWCRRSHRLTSNPFADVPRANQKTDPRHQRRALTESELRRLLEVASRRSLAEYGRVSVPRPPDECEGRQTWTKAELEYDTLGETEKRGREVLAKKPAMIVELEQRGRERALIYKTLVFTGLRKGELTSLTVGQLELDGPVAYAVLHAADEKNRQGSEIPLRADLAAELMAWLSHRLETLREDSRAAGDAIPARLPSSTPLFNVPTGLSRILNRDLAAAGIAKRDERGRVVDVHAMRHTFGTHLSKGGVPLRTAQAAMRHSKPDLTANVYTDPRLLDVVGALDALPALPLHTGEPDRGGATGTDDRHGALAPDLAPAHDHSGAIESSAVQIGHATSSGDTSRGASASVGPDKRKPPLTSAVNGGPQKRVKGFEPSTFTLAT